MHVRRSVTDNRVTRVPRVCVRLLHTYGFGEPRNDPRGQKMTFRRDTFHTNKQPCFPHIPRSAHRTYNVRTSMVGGSTIAEF